MSHTRRAFAGGCIALLLALWLCHAAGASGQGRQYLVYIGTYTQQKSKGIYAWRFDATSGQLESLGLAAEIANPSFLAVHPNGRFLYAVNEVADFDGKKAGSVSAFAVDRASGKLNFLNRASSGGPGPCYLAVDKTGRDVLAANYGGGSVTVLPLSEDGRVKEASAFVQHRGSGTDPKRQEGPHAHSINLSPDNRFAIAADLGLDRLLVYRLDAGKGTLVANDPPFARVNPGAGPRHFTFHPGGKFAYVINEMGSTVTVFSWDAASGALKELQTVSTLPDGFKGENWTAEVQAHPSGRFLYGSNRGHNSIAVFAIDASKGTLALLEHVPTQGKWPRNFAIDPTGAWLFAANQQSDSVVLFRIDARTGRLAPAGQTLEVGSPVCVKFVPLE